MIEIREMQWDDLDQVMEIENACFSNPWTETGFFSFLIREDTLFLVAQDEEEILGYCGIVMVQDEGDIMNVAVAEKARNRGIGGMLMLALTQKTKENGINKIFLEVRESNLPAIHLYEKMGFAANGRRKNYYEAPREDAILMMREQL